MLILDTLINEENTNPECCIDGDASLTPLARPPPIGPITMELLIVSSGGVRLEKVAI
jgi:hypothetical protein